MTTTALEVVVGADAAVLAGAEGAAVILAGPRQERPGGIVGAHSPLAQGDSGLLGLRGDAHEGVNEGVAGYAEIVLEERNERMVYAVVPGRAVRWRCARIDAGHEDHPFVVRVPGGTTLAGAISFI